MLHYMIAPLTFTAVWFYLFGLARVDIVSVFMAVYCPRPAIRVALATVFLPLPLPLAVKCHIEVSCLP